MSSGHVTSAATVWAGVSASASKLQAFQLHVHIYALCIKGSRDFNLSAINPSYLNVAK